MKKNGQLNKARNIRVNSWADHVDTSVVERGFLDDTKQMEWQRLILLNQKRGLATLPSKVFNPVVTGEQHRRLVQDLRSEVSESHDLPIDLAADGF
jgi:hypothetical protein